MSKVEHIKLSKKILAEKELLFGCITNKEFIQRLITQFMQKMRRDDAIGSMISAWENKIIEDEALRSQAYIELSEALKKVKIVLEDLKKQKVTITFQRGSHLSAEEEIVNDICSEGSFFSCREPPYARVYYKLQALYIQHISKSHEIEFAPSALAAIKRDQSNNFWAQADCEPAYLWLQLMLIERAWAVADKPNSIAWERIPEDDEIMWLKADSAFRLAFRNWMADELRNSDDPNYPMSFFNRKNTQSLIDRLLKEIELNMDSSDVTSQPTNPKNRRTQQYEDDIKAMIPFAMKLWKQELIKCQYPMRLGRKEMAVILLSQLPNHISLHSKDKKRIPRAIKALEITDPRDIDIRGLYQGLKPHWERFEYVKI